LTKSGVKPDQILFLPGIFFGIKTKKTNDLSTKKMAAGSFILPRHSERHF